MYGGHLDCGMGYGVCCDRVWVLICLLENLDRRVEGSVVFLFCVSRIRPVQNHSLPAKGQKAEMRNKSNV